MLFIVLWSHILHIVSYVKYEFHLSLNNEPLEDIKVFNNSMLIKISIHRDMGRVFYRFQAWFQLFTMNKKWRVNRNIC